MSEWIYDPKAGRCRKTDGGQAMSDDMTNLSPCPFCGGGETEINESKTRASLLEPDEVISVYVRHRCGGFARGAQSATILVRGRNRSDAIAAWNRRAVLEDKP